MTISANTKYILSESSLMRKTFNIIIVPSQQCARMVGKMEKSTIVF